ncbi:MAG: hypothetical protein ABI651_16845, partial [Verrucomicrobiota bacterium]
GALSNLDHKVSHQTVANMMKRHDIAPAPERGKTMSWREFIRSHLEVLGEASLREVLSNYVLHFHGERNHQGKGNVILFPRPEDRIGESTGEIRTREGLGGLLRFYYRQAA